MKRLYDTEVTEPFENSHERKLWVMKSRKKLKKIVEEDFLPLMPGFDPVLACDSLRQIEELFKCKIYCWRTATTKSKWECYRHAPFSANYETTVDIVIQYNPVGMSLDDVGVLLEVDFILPPEKRYKRSRWTIFEAVALLKRPELFEEIKQLRKEVKILEESWGRKSVHITDAKEFWQKYKLSLQVWRIHYNEFNKVKRSKVFDFPRFPNLIGMIQNC